MKIYDISKPLDEQTAVFPGDVPFSRDWIMNLERGDSCNVSTLHGSAHAGTHLDMPLHVQNTEHEFTLDTFIGKALVIKVNQWSDLLPKNIPEKIRVLFKTKNSNTNYTDFDQNYLCITKEIVNWLIKHKALLIGVDAPSVDPVDSKTLDNHHLLFNNGIAILENLDLSEVHEGDYELIALPLKTPKTDASWTRAVLIKR